LIIRIHVVNCFLVWIYVNALDNIHLVYIIDHQFIILRRVALLVDHGEEVKVYVNVNEFLEAYFD